MARRRHAEPGGTLEQVAIGTATLVVALLGYMLVPQLDEALFAGMLAAVAAMLTLGTYLLGRGQPGFAALGRPYTWTLWVPPVAWFVAGAAVLRLVPVADGLPLAAMAVTLLGGIVAAQQRELDLSAAGRRGAEFVVSLGAFASAFALFGALYEARVPGPIGPALTAVTAALLASVPLRRAGADEPRTALYCLVAGVVVGQIAWGISYWATPAIVAGALLLLLFYVLVGLGEAILDRSFGRRVLLEYGVVGACGLALIVGAGPWRG